MTGDSGRRPAYGLHLEIGLAYAPLLPGNGFARHQIEVAGSKIMRTTPPLPTKQAGLSPGLCFDCWKKAD